ncbi:hypothetical protein [Actinacidiphila glaucinigra]|uniref:hypothetical protein n=1 Tax=Actinacidiphila glaucinigra TaxID=235986 RepID=UPI0035DFE48A
MPDINEIIAAARPREATVPVCIRGDLAGEVERLELELSRVQEDWEPSSIADEHPGRAIAAQIKALREEMRAAEVPFKLRYIGDEAYSTLVAAHPSTDERELFDAQSFTPALVSACCVEPAMTVDQAKALFEKINQGEIKKLFDAAWDVHNSGDVVPFSLAASALLTALGGEK